MKIKKLLLRLVIVLVALVILAFIVIGMFLDRGIKKGVEAFGPKYTKVEIKLKSVSLSLFSGSGKVSGLVIGNPEGYKTPSAISISNASLALSPGSLFSDKIVVKSINIQAPEVTYETDLKHSNIRQILDNLEETTGGGKAPAKTAPADSKPGKKLQVDEFVISGAKLNVSATLLGGRSASVTLPEIRFTDLGKGPEGITGAELAKRALTALEEAALPAAKTLIADLEKNATAVVKDLGKGGQSNAVEKVTKSLGDLLKKK